MGEYSDVGVSFSDRVRMGDRNEPVVDYRSGDVPLAEYALDVATYAGLEIVGDTFEQCAVIHRELANVRVGVCNDWAR